MAHIERKVYYVGIWREDKVTDSTMGHIIARSQAEKGQKVKVKLSQGGLILSKTVLFQENLISSMALQDVYFLTVNQRHPCCLLCIGADPVRNYLIQVLRTVNPVEAQELISTFKALKDNPTIDSGNVVLRRKDNGKWTLRERSQHNANRHLQEVFKEDPGLAPPTTLSQPNGSAGGGHAPVIDGDKATNGDGRSRYRLVPDDALGGNGGLVMVPAQREVDELSQELQDVKLVVEKTGSVSPAVLRRSLSRNSSKNKVITVVNSNDDNNNNNDDDDDDDDDKSPYIETEVLPVTTNEHNGGVIHVYSTGGTEEAQEPEEKAGEVRVVVEDYRQDGVVRAHSNGSAGTNPTPSSVHVTGNGSYQRPVAVPESGVPSQTPQNPAPNGYTDIPAYKIHRHVSTELVQVPNFTGRMVSQSGSLRSTATTTGSTRVSFDPVVSSRRGSYDPRQFRTLRTRGTRLPSTIVRPIEQVYAPHVRPASTLLKPAGSHTLLVPQAAPPGSVVYVPVVAPGEVVAYPAAAPRRRRSRPSSIHVMEGNELRVFRKTGEADDILL